MHQKDGYTELYLGGQWILLCEKYEFYGLNENYNYFDPGSQSASIATITSAYNKGEPIVSYHWDPTWLTGKLDLVLLEDAPLRS